jgi:hypothetical protein
MSETGNEVPDDAVAEALLDHHLDEVATMIERAQADKPSSESPIGDSPAGYRRRP